MAELGKLQSRGIVMKWVLTLDGQKLINLDHFERMYIFEVSKWNDERESIPTGEYEVIIESPWRGNSEDSVAKLVMFRGTRSRCLKYLVACKESLC